MWKFVSESGFIEGFNGFGKRFAGVSPFIGFNPGKFGGKSAGFGINGMFEVGSVVV